MLKNIFFKVIGGFSQSILIFLRGLIIGGVTIVFLILNIDQLTDSRYGVNNLVIISSSFVFFPTFFFLMVELFLWELRKNRRISQKIQKQVSQSDL